MLLTTPICFVPPNPALGLTERAEQASIQGICETAARKQGVPVVALGNSPCLTVTTIWAARATGDREGDCVPTWTGAECESAAVHLKSLKLVVAQPATGKVLAETTAAVRSSHSQFSQESFHALCTAAFHDFPRPLANAQFDVPMD
jgi:hypothetical protein